MDQWKKHITIGNSYFRNQRFDEAEIHYLKARQHAESLFASWLDPQEAVAALVVSYHNLADLYQAENQPSLAFDMLSKVHSLLLKAADFSAENTERQAAVRSGVRQTYAALLNHMKTHDQASGFASC